MKTSKPADHAARMERALLSLDGLSVGDAFGERFFLPPQAALSMVEQRATPRGPWRYTDDTEMALGIVQVLEEHGRIDQDALAQVFGARYRENPHRGYGGTAHGILEAIYLGEPWRRVSSQVFGGTGSMGNGGAMRVGPLGAYFADDLSPGGVRGAGLRGGDALPSGGSGGGHRHRRGGRVGLSVPGAAAHPRAHSSRWCWTTPRPVRRGEGWSEHEPCRSRLRRWRRRRSWAADRESSPRTRCPSPCGARRATWTTTRRRSGPRSPAWEIATPPAPSWEASSR